MNKLKRGRGIGYWHAAQPQIPNIPDQNCPLPHTIISLFLSPSSPFLPFLSLPSTALTYWHQQAPSIHWHTDLGVKFVGRGACCLESSSLIFWAVWGSSYLPALQCTSASIRPRMEVILDPLRLLWLYCWEGDELSFPCSSTAAVPVLALDSVQCSAVSSQVRIAVPILNSGDIKLQTSVQPYIFVCAKQVKSIQKNEPEVHSEGYKAIPVKLPSLWLDWILFIQAGIP